LPVEPEDHAQVPAGAELARAALARARARFGPRRPTPRPRPASPAGGGEPNDPAPLGRALAELLADRGWAASVNAASVITRWAELVGPEVAGHARPEDLTDGVLTVTAESTAWATQLRLLEPVLLDRISHAVGDSVVRRLAIRGPAGPDWRHGPRRVRGRGPRDTYG
jgi:predicted nucleic acid-binding Zn ribbon protein